MVYKHICNISFIKYNAICDWLQFCSYYNYILANEDFETDILQVNFLPGQSHSNACVIIIDDDIREGNENFYLLLSVPYNVSAQPYYADVQIIGSYNV